MALDNSKRALGEDGRVNRLGRPARRALDGQMEAARTAGRPKSFRQPCASFPATPLPAPRPGRDPSAAHVLIFSNDFTRMRLMRPRALRFGN